MQRERLTARFCSKTRAYNDSKTMREVLWMQAVLMKWGIMLAPVQDRGDVSERLCILGASHLG